MDKFQNKYRIESSRLHNWDYTSKGSYFITICTKNRQFYFGDCINGKMKLSNIGETAKNELLKTESMRKNVKLDEWVVMPNHVHAIIIIENPVSDAVETQGVASGRGDAVETQCIASLRP